MSELLSFDGIPYNDREILRYSGIKALDTVTESLINECKKECEQSFNLKVCYSIESILFDEKALKIGDITTLSHDLIKNLSGHAKCVVFVLTAGFEIDRLIKKYAKVSPSKSLIFSAIGSERAESTANAFCDFIAKTYRCKPRFSPGFGDLELSVQKDIFRLLDATKRLGVTLNDSMLMSPSKSVSAFMGIRDK